MPNVPVRVPEGDLVYKYANHHKKCELFHNIASSSISSLHGFKSPRTNYPSSPSLCAIPRTLFLYGLLRSWNHRESLDSFQYEERTVFLILFFFRFLEDFLTPGGMVQFVRMIEEEG